MALETGTNIGDLVIANPTGSDPKSVGDDHLRLIKTAARQSFAGFTGAVLVTGVDGGAANTYTLTPATALLAYTSKTLVEFTPNADCTGAATLNISGLGAKPIITQAGLALTAGDLASGRAYLAAYDGTSFRLISVTTAYVDAVRTYATSLAFATALPAQVLGFLSSTGTVASFGTTHTGYAQNEVKGADIASAATINLTTATGNLVHVTGTTTITAITIPVGAERTVIFDGALTLTHGVALLLPGAVNILTAANDRMIVRGDTAGAIVVSYTRASGVPLGAFPYLNVRDEKASGTAAGASVAADITQTRTLNTTKTNTMGASLASNTITLLAGTYQIRARAPSCGGGFHKAYLYNSSDSTYPIIGSSSKETAKNTNADSFVSGQFTITATKNFTIRHYTSVGVATDGLGQASSTGDVEVFTEVEMWKVA